MTEPWDPLPFPKRGNASQNALFAAMGGALIAWEEIEIALAHLYAAMRDGDRFHSEANHAYGVPLNFRERFSGLQSVAEKYFIRRPSQDAEGEFCRLTRFILGFSARRNDIAHSHALLIEFIRAPGTPGPSILGADAPLRWCLVVVSLDVV